MNHFSKYNDSKKSIIFFLLLFVVLASNTSVFSQSLEKNVGEEATNELGVVKEDRSSANANANFVIWFMGAKQTPIVPAVPTNGINSKKQIMTTGTAPNRLLIKAFFKKVVNFESSLA